MHLRRAAVVLTVFCIAARRARRTRGRDLPLAVHGEDHRAGGLRLRLHARRRRDSATATTSSSPWARTRSKPGYGKVVRQASMPGRHEAHHGDFTDDRRQLWLGGLDSSEIFVFDVATDPGKPKLVKTIKDFVARRRGGVVGPHTFYALPGRMLITGSRTRRTAAARRRWSSTATRASTCARSGCRRARSTATTRA